MPVGNGVGTVIPPGGANSEETPTYRYRYLNQLAYPRDGAEYILVIRQQPEHSRMCGVGAKADRRPIDPPPVVELKLNNPMVPNDKSYLFNPYLFMYVCLVAVDTNEEVHLLPDRKTRATTGSTVSSLFHIRDHENKEGAFFVFADMSVRVEGTYRLKFMLYELIADRVQFLKSIESKPFKVYSAKAFPGMSDSTELSKAFAEQGLKIRIRKDNTRRRSTNIAAATNRASGQNGIDSDGTAGTNNNDLNNDNYDEDEYDDDANELSAQDMHDNTASSATATQQRMQSAPPEQLATATITTAPDSAVIMAEGQQQQPQQPLQTGEASKRMRTNSGPQIMPAPVPQTLPSQMHPLHIQSQQQPQVIQPPPPPPHHQHHQHHPMAMQMQFQPQQMAAQYAYYQPTMQQMPAMQYPPQVQPQPIMPMVGYPITPQQQQQQQQQQQLLHQHHSASKAQYMNITAPNATTSEY